MKLLNVLVTLCVIKYCRNYLENKNYELINNFMGLNFRPTSYFTIMDDVNRKFRIYYVICFVVSLYDDDDSMVKN